MAENTDIDFLHYQGQETFPTIMWEASPDADMLFRNVPSNVLLSRRVAPTVPSAQKGLTAVFGMGTGVALSL